MKVAHVRRCPGLAGQDQTTRQEELKGLLEIAHANGRQLRKRAEKMLMREGWASRCSECGKKTRHDRVVAHILLHHLEIRAWACPLWCVCGH
jgi:hypothetical protein